MIKKIISVVIVLILLLLLVPVRLKDGGSVEYKALTYHVMVNHALAEDEVYGSGYTEGISVKVLGFEVYNNEHFVKDGDSELSNDASKESFTEEPDVKEQVLTTESTEPIEDDIENLWRARMDIGYLYIHTMIRRFRILHPGEYVY